MMMAGVARLNGAGVAVDSGKTSMTGTSVCGTGVGCPNPTGDGAGSEPTAEQPAKPSPISTFASVLRRMASLFHTSSTDWQEGASRRPGPNSV